MPPLRKHARKFPVVYSMIFGLVRTSVFRGGPQGAINLVKEALHLHPVLWKSGLLHASPVWSDVRLIGNEGIDSLCPQCFSGHGVCNEFCPKEVASCIVPFLMSISSCQFVPDPEHAIPSSRFFNQKLLHLLTAFSISGPTLGSYVWYFWTNFRTHGQPMGLTIPRNIILESDVRM